MCEPRHEFVLVVIDEDKNINRQTVAGMRTDAYY